MSTQTTGCVINPFTAVMSFQKQSMKVRQSIKVRNLKPFRLFILFLILIFIFNFIFLNWHVEGFSSKCIALKVDGVVGPEYKLFASASAHFSARKLYRLSWGSEGVNNSHNNNITLQVPLLLVQQQLLLPLPLLLLLLPPPLLLLLFAAAAATAAATSTTATSNNN